MLQKMMSNLLEEETNDVAANEVDQSDCEADSLALSSAIEDANSQFEQDLKDIRTAELALESVQEELDLAESSKAAKEQQLSELQDQRNSEAAVFESDEADISNALATLYNGKLILKQLLQESESSVFLQTKKGVRKSLFVEFSNTLYENSVAQPGLRGLMNYFSQLLSRQEIQADQEVVQKVLDLIDTLIDKLNEDSTNETNTEIVRKEVFEREKVELESEISQLGNEIVEVTTGMSNLQETIENLKQDSVSQEQIQNEKGEELKIKEKSCSDLQSAFEERSESRKEEIKIIEQAVDIFKNRFEKVRDYLGEIQI